MTIQYPGNAKNGNRGKLRATEALTKYLPALSDAQDQHDHKIVVDLAYQTVITHAVLSELPKS
jgi:hypothetical protein